MEKVIRVFARKTKVQIDDSLLENLEYERFGSIFEKEIYKKPSRALCEYFSQKTQPAKIKILKHLTSLF